MPKSQHIEPCSRISPDPLTAALQPPPNESPEDRAKRIQDELDAKRISELIDDQLHKERNERKKVRSEVSVLLLGQSESGKSTTLKRESASSSSPATVKHSLHPLYPVGRPMSSFSRPLFSTLYNSYLIFDSQSSNYCTLVKPSTRSELPGGQ